MTSPPLTTALADLMAEADRLAAAQLCTSHTWTPVKFCGVPATVRQGVRCLNGCWGEGEFDYACDSHSEELANRDWYCNACGRLLERFPVQAIAPAAEVTR